MGVMQYLRDRISAGATVDELVSEGYKKSSAYAARSQSNAGNEITRSNRQSQPNRNSLSSNVERDPEVQELRNELAKTKLRNQITEAKGESKRLQILEERYERLEIWVVEIISNLSQSIFDLNPDVMDHWQDAELNHLKNGGPHWGQR